MRVDAHQHFWHPLRGDYGWMPEDNAILSRPYAPKDLIPHLAHCDIDGSVLVQAAPSVEETEYMLGLADGCDSVKGVVGWVDFEDPAHLHHLKRLARHPKFLGVRPMIQDIPDVDWMLRDDVQWAYKAIVDLDLTFDALGFPQHLPNFVALLQRHPDMRVVVNHCMKPKVRDAMAGQNAFDEWADGISQLASETGAYCKFSGLVTEAADGWDIEDLRPFADHILKAFCAQRVMWGSDWPVCRLQAEYEHWHDIAKSLTAPLSQDEQDAVFGGTAAHFYRLAS